MAPVGWKVSAWSTLPEWCTAVPAAVTNVVSRTMVWSTYARWAWNSPAGRVE
jgi:hypothetical protein